MTRATNHRYEAIWWSIEILEGWSVCDDSECATLTSAKFKGVLQVSAYRKDSDIGEGELFEFADQQAVPESVEIAQFAGLCNTHETEGLRWKKWWLAKGRTLLFITYNGPVRSADSEIRAAEELLRTLEVRP